MTRRLQLYGTCVASMALLAWVLSTNPPAFVIWFFVAFFGGLSVSTALSIGASEVWDRVLADRKAELDQLEASLEPEARP